MTAYRCCRYISIIFVALIALTISGCASSEKSEPEIENKTYGVVTARTLSMRMEAAKASGSVSAEHMGDTVEVLEEGEGWHKVHYGDHEGYVISKYIQILVPKESEAVAEIAAQGSEAATPADSASVSAKLSFLERLKLDKREKADKPMSPWAFWIAFVGLLIVACVVMALCFRLNKYYDEYSDPADWPAWASMLSGIAISAVAVFVGLLLPYGYVSSVVIFGMALLCGAALAVNGAWGIQRFGLDENFEQTRRWAMYQLGRLFCNLLYAFLFCLFSLVTLSILGSFVFSLAKYIDNVFFAIVAFIVLAFIVSLVYMLFYFFVEECYGNIFYSANPLAYWVIIVATYIILFFILNTLCTMNLARWPFLNFILLIENFCMATILCVMNLKEKNKRRCRICHDNNAECVRSIFSHTSTDRSTQWKEDYEAQRLNGRLSDENRERMHIVGYEQTTESTYDNFIDIYQCPRCGYEWKRKRRKMIDSNTTIGRVRYIKK